jgi:hypothetical protein
MGTQGGDGEVAQAGHGAGAVRVQTCEASSARVTAAGQRLQQMLRNSVAITGAGANGPAVTLTNVQLWLQFPKLATDRGKVVHRLEGVGVVVAQHPSVAGQSLFVKLAG